MTSLLSDLLLLRIDGNSITPMNKRLYVALRSAIHDSSLPAGSRLPASRVLAADLKIARNTVLNAYEQLWTEGYIYSQQGSGTFVAELVPGPFPTNKLESTQPTFNQIHKELSERGERIVNEAAASPHQWGAFMPGVQDLTMFPYKKLGRIICAWWRRPQSTQLSYSYGGGSPELRKALANYLSITRSVNCDADQIIITEGSHQAIDLTSRLLGNVGDLAWMEDPGYWGARTIFKANGLNIAYLPVDKDGMCLSTDIHGIPKLIFVTPSHQYPLGAVMSLERRLQLLEFAKRSGSWIIEDDYDSEFRYSGRPISALQGLEPDVPVIYIGTFSKTLAPGLRIGYLILPRRLAVPFRQAHAELYREGNLPMHSALADFIVEGHYAAHIRRMRLVYARRRTMLVSLIERRLGKEWLHQDGSDAGLHLVLKLPQEIQDRLVVAAARRKKILVTALSSYYAKESKRGNGLLLGYACVPDTEMVSKFELLIESIAEVAKATYRAQK